MVFMQLFLPMVKLEVVRHLQWKDMSTEKIKNLLNNNKITKVRELVKSK